MNPDFRDMLCAFCERGVEFLLVGAYALSVHGHPRATGHMDLYVRPTPANASRVIEALRAFGAPLEGVSSIDFATPGITYQIGRAPGRTDLITSLEGLTWAEAWEGRIVRTLAGLEVPVLGLDSLRRNKRALGRPKDLADLAWLESPVRDRG